LEKKVQKHLAFTEQSVRNKQIESGSLKMVDDGAATLPSYVGIALGITSQDWRQLGLGDDPAVAPSDDLDETVHRITALLLIRIAAWIQPRGKYSDLSTTSVCRTVLADPTAWPSEKMDQDVMDQLKLYVKTILSGYQDVPYHSFKHCYHVTISANKLMDMILQRAPGENSPTTYGFRDDPLMQFSLLFSALIHDVQHQGIPNRQLANEDDALAIKYNDQSIAENQSLYIGFSELLKSDYQKLRDVLFPQKDDYRRFRCACVDLVLSTDIASPERSQVGKSKWKEAFGDPYETVERKVLKQLERRASATSTVKHKASRRMSTQSIMSDLSIDTPKTKYNHSADLDDDSSVSLSPDSSEHEDNGGNRRNGTKEGTSADLPMTNGEPAELPLKSSRMRKVKGGGYDKSPISQPSSALEDSTHSDGQMLQGMALKFHRRLSTSAGPTSKRYRNTRLGLLRTVDLSGESIEAYNASHATRTSATGADVSHLSHRATEPPEKVDPLRESVIMETILKAADVGHNLQGFDQMALWSNRLFLELRRAFVQGRGESPQDGWFRNQIGFLEAYLLPLARKLDDTGVWRHSGICLCGDCGRKPGALDERRNGAHCQYHHGW
jgi:3'5'-cyclic nucleotide phosphodiesterase